MFCQLFGKFLIEKEVIDKNKYNSIMERLAESRAKLGVIAVADGIITEKQANEINHLQTTKDARFGEIAVGEGYITEEQLDVLLKKQGSAYAIFLSVLSEAADISVSKVDELLKEFQKEHGFTDEDMDELVNICDHVVFNSVSQLKKHKARCIEAGVSFGLRVNPEFSTQGDHAIYDPCAPGSRLGVTLKNLKAALEEEPDVLSGMEGIHFHTLCEQNSDDLEATLKAVEEKFGFLMKDMKWVNFGGGHHITREDYDIETLEKCISHVRRKYDVQVYVEPGEAVALNAGYLVTTVLDKVENGITTLILDASAACHMPDVLEMPYTPPLRGGLKISDMEDEYGIDKDIEINFDMDVKEGIWKPAKNGRYRYRLSSYTCLAGDIIGDYQFGREINVGDRLVFEDMAIYSMVKNNTFNGIPLPDIVIMDSDGECKVWKHFGYEDFKGRL